jgi:hypothetical protein
MYHLARKLHREGVETRLFGYHAGAQSFEEVRDRLRARILSLPEGAPYVAVGHSLGGLLLRAALQEVPAERYPRHLFMLATPNKDVTLARLLRSVVPYRLWNGDAGQMLADAERMGAVPPPPPEVPATVVAGTRGIPVWPFRGAANDAIVTVEETRPDARMAHVEHLSIPSFHTFIMNHPEVYRIIRERAPGLFVTRRA